MMKNYSVEKHSFKEDNYIGKYVFLRMLQAEPFLWRVTKALAEKYAVKKAKIKKGVIKKVLITGGGTAGHVIPNIPVIRELKKRNITVYYAGMKDSIEEKLIISEGIKFFRIHSGKLRRYLDFKNFIDIFRIIRGLADSLRILMKTRPDAVFSKGGYVSCPVVWAAWLLRIPSVIHESDLTPGLANRLSMPFTDKICYTFPETAQYLNRKKSVFTGMPVREEISKGDAEKGKIICGFNDTKPVVLAMGGSQGSLAINKAVRNSLKGLLLNFNLCHICGPGNKAESLNGVKGYKQFEFIRDELPDVFAAADVFVARAGATSIFEFLTAGKPSILIPLTRSASRGDQILNAKSFERQGFSVILDEAALDAASLITCIGNVINEKDKYKKAISMYTTQNAAAVIASLITSMKG